MNCRLLRAALAASFVFVAASHADAQWVGPKVSDSLSIQGYLTDPGGTPIDGNVPITFKLYKGAAQVWSRSLASVPVTDGVFSALVGGNNLDTVAFNGQMDLGVTVDSDPEISPRTPLVTTAFARAVPGFYSFYAQDINWRTWNVVAGAPNNRIENPTQSVGNTIGGGGGRSTGGSTANVINGDFNTISGGHGNSISTFDATIGGGINNSITGGFQSVIGGGYQNSISQFAGTIAGGSGNRVTGSTASIGGGSQNVVGAAGGTVGGGEENRAMGARSTVPGGYRNQARGDYSLAAGYRARAVNSGSFVWNDRSIVGGNDSLLSTASNQFLIRAAGGVGIGTNAPEEQLHILEASGSTAIKLGGNGTNGPHGIVFEDDSDDGGVQLLWRTADNQLILERTSQGTGVNGTDAFVYDRDDQRFLFTGSRSQAANFNAHLFGIDNTGTGGSDGLAIRLGDSNAGGGNNFISFFDGDNDSYGRIEGNGSNGVSYVSTGGDYAEYVMRLDPSERLASGQVVAVVNGKITLNTELADRVMAITDRPAVLGNMPDHAREDLYERVAFVGQVPVTVVGSVESGDYLLPSGLNDGIAVALRPHQLRPRDLDRIVGVAWQTSSEEGPKKVIAEVGLDRARATRLAFENELARLWTIVEAQNRRLEQLEASRDL